MVKISCKDLTKAFQTPGGEIVAVDSVDMDLEDGEFYAIVGPSGCGKTTLLRMIAGLEYPSTGEIYFGEKNVTNVRPQDRHISMVFQNISLFPYLTVKKNIAYGLKYEDLEDDEKSERIEEMAEMLGISDHLSKKPGQLSGGQRQRVSLARALVRRPSVFLLDEPMSDLDAKLKINLRKEIKELQKKFDITTIYVTHDQEEAMSLSDKVIVMENGKIQQLSTPEETYQKPNNLFVAKFIGSPMINTFTGWRIKDRIKTESFEFDKNDIDLSSWNNGEDGLIVGIRPSSFSLDNNHSNSLKCEAEIIENIGERSIIHANLDGKPVRLIVDSKETPVEGESVEVSFNSNQVHLFDPMSGARIG